MRCFIIESGRLLDHYFAALHNKNFDYNFILFSFRKKFRGQLQEDNLCYSVYLYSCIRSGMVTNLKEDSFGLLMLHDKQEI